MPPRHAACRRLLTASTLATAAVLLASCANRTGPVALACGQLPAALASLPGLRITQADNLAADDKGHPAHCLVKGALNERTGSDGKRYAIGFEMRLPQGWNQRFLHQVNGGNDGVVKPAWGDLGVMTADALSRGFAVISSDAGHAGEGKP